MVIAAVAVFGLSATPAAAAPASAVLTVSAAFDKAGYRTGETIGIRFEVRNDGDAPATEIRVSYSLTNPNRIVTDLDSWGVLNTGATIAPGETLTVAVTGQVADPAVTTGELDGFLYDSTGFGVATFDLSTPVTPRFGHVTGVVYADANDNAAFDPGEGLEGATVTAYNTVAYQTAPFQASTDATGTFDFAQLPTVPMRLTATAPNGWPVGYQYVTVEETGVDDLRMRAARPLTDLTADLAFTKDTYRPVQQAKVTVTLTNTGDRPLAGLFANCNRSGSPNGLRGTGPGWGELSITGGDGVTVGPNQTRTIVVTERVPRAARDYGKVWVACDFSYRFALHPDNPFASDSAAVPGAVGRLTGTALHYPNGYEQPPVGVGGLRVVAVTEADCPIAEATSGPDGAFGFARLPVGEYDLYLFAPDGWQVRYSNPTAVGVRPGTATVFVELTPGTATPPTLPNDCPQ